MTDTGLGTVTVLGLGQVGTSIALALRDRGVRVLLTDRDRRAVDAAVDQGAGECLDEGAPPADLLVIAVSPEELPWALRSAQDQNLASVYTDVASVKAVPATRARQLGCDMAGFVPGHPIGEETFAGDVARPDLFRGTAWALCQDEDVRPDAVRQVRRLAELCGAMPVQMDADTHDRLVALISHAPHLIASAMAGALVDAPVEALRLRPAGMRDMTSPAAGDPELWCHVLNQNARWVSCVLSEIAADLVDACAALQLASSGDDSYFGEVAELLRRGHAGRRRLNDAGQRTDMMGGNR